MTALRWLLAALVALVGWLAVMIGDAGYAIGTALGEVADRIRGPP